ncbi:MAG: alpha/beta fold hydrolase [Pseudomonas sp.]
MTALDHQLLDVNGITLSLYSAGPLDGYPVWLLHGFPECWHSWRNQTQALAEAGYRVLVPEMRGYGQSSAPTDPAAYDVFSICADIQAAMNALGQDKLCVIGHDWGAQIAWHLALLEPQRVESVVGMAVPFGGRAKKPAIEIMRQIHADSFNYIVYFQTPGVAERELDADIAKTMRMMMHNSSAAVPKDFFLQAKPLGARLFDGMQDPGALLEWCSEEAFAVYLQTFDGRGFYGALNWYRNFERNWELSASIAGQRVEQPALFIIGDKDPVATLEAYTLKRMPELVPRVEQHVLEDCGHWIQNEKAAEVNRLLLEFLARHA